MLMANHGFKLPRVTALMAETSTHEPNEFRTHAKSLALRGPKHSKGYYTDRFPTGTACSSELSLDVLDRSEVAARNRLTMDDSSSISFRFDRLPANVTDQILGSLPLADCLRLSLTSRGALASCTVRQPAFLSLAAISQAVAAIPHAVSFSNYSCMIYCCARTLGYDVAPARRGAWLSSCVGGFCKYVEATRARTGTLASSR